MSGELVRLFSGARSIERQRGDELAAIEHQGDKGDAWAREIGRVTRRAAYETLQTDLIRLQAERLSPGCSELVAMIELAGAIECTRVIGDLYRPGGLR